MTTRTKPNPNHQDRLRKAAIVLQSLEPDVAERMLDQFDDETARQIRDWILDLPAISPEEEKAVIREFLGQDARPSEPPRPNRRADDDVTLELSGREPVTAAPASKPATESSRPFARLQAATPELLIEFLQDEHPQVIAVVLSHIAPKVAAEVIRNLHEKYRGDVLARIGRLREIDRLALEGIEDQLAQKLQTKLIETSGEEPGEATLAAILAATPSDEHARYTRELRSQAPVLADRVSQRLEDSASTNDFAEHADEYVGTAKQQSRREQSKAANRNKPSFRFADLINLDDRALAGVLARCDAKVLIIALAGAEQALVDRICNRLDRRQARELRMRIASPGPLALTDVDEAQRRVAAQAELLLSHARPTSRRAA